MKPCKGVGWGIVPLLLGNLLVLPKCAGDETWEDGSVVLERKEALNLDTYRDEQLKYSMESVMKIEGLIYPDEVDAYTALVNYDEIPVPIPFGPSVWFIIVTTLAIVWYVTELVRYLVKRYTSKLELFPKTEAFPRLYVHWLQQSKRECNLRREARNTWCYTAKTLLMSPEDPLMDIEEACSTSWADQQHHRNIWQIVRVVVIANGMLRQVRERNRYLKITAANAVKERNESKAKIEDEAPAPQNLELNELVKSTVESEVEVEEKTDSAKKKAKRDKSSSKSTINKKTD